MSTLKHPYIHCMYAEDVRQETDGRFSVIGVFAGGLKVVSAPTQIPKLAVIADVFIPQGVLPKNIKVEVLRDNEVLQTIQPGTELFNALENTKDMQGMFFQVVVGFVGFPIEAPTSLQARAVIDDLVLESNHLKIQVG